MQETAAFTFAVSPSRRSISGTGRLAAVKSGVTVWTWICPLQCVPVPLRFSVPIRLPESGTVSRSPARVNRVTVLLNGKLVIDNAQLPGLPAKGPVALQHHTDPMQFANIYIKEL